MKSIFAPLACVFCFFAGPAYSESTFQLSPGTYALQGINPGAETVTTYKGQVTIIPEGKNYRVDWKIGNTQTQTGIGILSGNVLSVAYYDGSGYSTGVVSYVLTADRNLEGEWAAYGSKEQGREILKWQADPTK